jgi:hypothetical protein
VFFRKRRTATILISFFKAHKRLSIIFALWAVLCSLILLPNWREGPFYLLFFSSLFLMLVASQVFWVVRFVDLGERFLPGKPRRAWLTAIASVVCLFFFACNMGPWPIPQGNSTHLTLRSILLQAPFWWWFVGS